MDYVSITYAKPNIEIYYWGTEKLTRCINYWSMLLRNKKNRKRTEPEKQLLGHLEQKSIEIEERETEELKIFSSCFNRTRKQKEDIVLVKDAWDESAEEKIYKVHLSI
jgi:hypothetical protein